MLSFLRLHRGPLPPPDVLKNYALVVKDGPERIMTMAENQSAHRMRMEKSALGSQSTQSLLGQIFTFVIAVGALYIAYDLAI